ncbi:uncharacterized protein LOC144493896 [Mustelus asterias]
MLTFSVLLWVVQLSASFEASHLPKPDLSVSPPKTKIVAGEKIKLNCRCQCPVTRIQYFYNSKETIYKDCPEENCKKHCVYSLDVVKGGNYTCQCLDFRNNEWIMSDESEPVQIHIAGGHNKSLYIGLGCAALIIVLLIVVFVICFIIKRGQKRNQLNERPAPNGGGIRPYQEDDGTYEEVNDPPTSTAMTIFSEIS